MLNNFRLGTRLIVGFSSVVLVFVAVCVVVVVLSREVEEKAHFVHTSNVPKSALATKILDSMYQMRLSTQILSHNIGGSNAGNYAEAVKKNRDDVLTYTGEFTEVLKKRASKNEEQARDLVNEGMTALIPIQEQLIKYAIEGNEAEALVELAKAQRTIEPAVASLRELLDYESARIKLRTEEIIAGVDTVITAIIASTVTAIVLALLAAFLVTRSITQPVGRMLETVEAMAGGDLSRTIVAESRDEIGELQSALGRMCNNLAQMIGEVRNGAKQLVSSASDLSCAATDVRKSSEMQSEAATAMAAALEQMSTSINHVSTLSEDARQTSSEAGQSAHSGSGTIHSMVNDIRQVSEAIAKGATTAQHLGKESERISTIVHVIRDVADQTNLLALNAAIEAARAGEQGRGFAVVADEVRKLAEKTTASAQEITEMVGSIQNDSTAMTTQMETTAQQMQAGVEQAQKAGGMISEINTGAQSVVRMIDEVSSALKEQAVASHDIAGRIEQIVHMVEENSSAVGSVASSAEQLNVLAATLSSGVERFRIPAG